MALRAGDTSLCPGCPDNHVVEASWHRTRPIAALQFWKTEFLPELCRMLMCGIAEKKPGSVHNSCRRWTRPDPLMYVI